MSLVIVPISEAMHGRGGFPIRTLIYVAFTSLLVYMYYIYNNAQHSLREAQMTGSRYQREAEERVNEIQDIVKAKDRYQESCQNEKMELHNRIKSLNQQYSMVQSQYKETEADFIKLRQDMDTLRSEHSQADSAHAAEYEKLKQEKDSDITKLKDNVADLTRQSQTSESVIANLRQRVKETENAYKHLLDKNAQLQLQLHNEPQQPADSRHAQQPQDALQQQQDALHQQQDALHQQQDAFHQQSDLLQPVASTQSPFGKHDNFEPVEGDKKLDPGQFDHPGQLFGDRDRFGHDTFGNQDNLGHDKFGNQDNLGHDTFNKDLHDNLNALNQVQPPSNNIIDNIDKKKPDTDLVLRPDVNPNDEQKAQLVEPILQHDSHQNGGVLSMNVRHEEDLREKQVRDEDAEGLHHKNPLALGQIEVPGEQPNLNSFQGQGKRDGFQHAPPLFNDENDHKEPDHGENQYFGEEEEAQQQQRDEERQQRQEQEEDERDDGKDGDFDSKFPDDLGHKDNKEAALVEDARMN